MLLTITPTQLSRMPWLGKTFTEGRLYVARPSQGRCWEVRDNLGHARIVLLDGRPCPHLVALDSRQQQRCVGRWDVEAITLD